MVSISSNFPPTNLEELRELLIRVDMIGLGESYWQKVISAPDQLLPVLDIARSMGSHSPAPCREDLSLRFRAGTGECEFCLKK